MNKLTVYERHYNNAEKAYMDAKWNSEWEEKCSNATVTAAEYLGWEQEANPEELTK